MDLVSMREAARVMGVSRQRVQQLLRAGRIPGAVKMDNGQQMGVWVIPRGSLRPSKKETNNELVD
jgi:excisionase family DNA binding protein